MERHIQGTNRLFERKSYTFLILNQCMSHFCTSTPIFTYGTTTNTYLPISRNVLDVTEQNTIVGNSN